ncbi:MAG: hypothetical protein MSC31_03430 [Solirubrobacteraceae bacterium MAG38_C4-C5]|nr:hypothetical protein [Candidatus Siliceabacter maunaloa]
MRVLLSDGGRHLASQSGYGQLAAGIWRHLPSQGHEIVLKPDDEVDVCLYVCPPSGIRPCGVPAATVAFTMHELEELPESKSDWVTILNGVDLVLTPTEWNREIWQRLGVTTPIDVVPLGVETAIYRPAKTPSFTVFTAHENLGSGSSRENWRDTLQAFYTAFRGRSDVELLVKTWRWKPDRWAQEKIEMASQLEMDLADAPPTAVMDDELSADEMRRLYQECWLFLKNANREGWGLPASEAVACGARVAASRIQPLLSHLPSDTAWFSVGDVDGLTEILRTHHAEYLEAMAKMHAYTWSRTAEAVGASISKRFTPAPAG